MKGRADLHAVRRILALLLVCTGGELRSFLSGGDTLKLQTISVKPKEKKEEEEERDGKCRLRYKHPNSTTCICVSVHTLVLRECGQVRTWMHVYACVSVCFSIYKCVNLYMCVREVGGGVE